ncbi:ATP-dependent RNA helicase SUV3 homolog, mitochondrial-like isoform X2 [Mya arenaria]|nr:ATP-dependent RNA helicase SUV3 homolog, mitochondrial-like isoform X2 [Mya arenaria]
MFPHIECIDELALISDLTDPTNWFPMARSMERKIIYHAGPTNSGKTYHALKAFMEAETGVYCGPLRLLAMEVYDKANNQGVPCDLVTGETRKFAQEDETPANHISCTVEMLKTDIEYDVAVIDEIQLIGDQQRGSSWTRALLGIAAREIHVCGEETAIDLVEKLTYMTGRDSFEVRRYERLTKLEYLDEALVSLDNLRDGDCIVCFRTLDIFNLLNKLRERKIKAAVIYGNLPPGTKIKQAALFNDTDNDYNILLATDAVGMGLNLSIKRMIFYSVTKIGVRHDGLKTTMPLTTSQALQIAGRAGRFRTRFEDGEVTTYFQKDLGILKKIVGQEKPKVTKAGLTPTVDMIESFSFLLPHASLSKLLDIFVHVATMNESYFMCHQMEMKALAEVIQDIPMSMRSKFTFCVAPLKVKLGFPRIMFQKMAKLLSEGHSLNFSWLSKNLGIPLKPPRTIAELQHLQAIFNVIDIYLWLSYRFAMFDDIELVQDLRVEVDTMIQSYLHVLNSNKDKQLLGNILPENILAENPLRKYQAAPKKRPPEDNIIPEDSLTENPFIKNNDAPTMWPPEDVMDKLFESDERVDQSTVAQMAVRSGGEVDIRTVAHKDVRSGGQVDQITVTQTAEQPEINKSETNANSTPQILSDFKDLTWRQPSTEDEEIIIISSASKPPAVSNSKNLEAVQTSSYSESLNPTAEEMESHAAPINPIAYVNEFTSQFAKSKTSSSTRKVINFWSDSELQPNANVPDNIVVKNTAGVISGDSVTQNSIAIKYSSAYDENFKSKRGKVSELLMKMEQSKSKRACIKENDTDFVKAFKRAKLNQIEWLNRTSKQTNSGMRKTGETPRDILSPSLLEELHKEFELENERLKKTKFWCLFK